MPDPISTQRLRAIPVALLAALLLVGCTSATKIQRPSTYVGEMTSAHLEDVYLATPDGKRLSFSEVFEGFEPQTGFATTALPFPRMDIARIVFEVTAPIATYYDTNANNNDYLEGPELLVLYIREGAIGLGYSVDYLGVNPRFNALATSPAETGGLLQFIKKNRGRMTENAQRLFRDLDQLGLEWRTRGRTGGGNGR